LKAIGVRRDATHGVERDRTTNDGIVDIAVDVCPHAREFDGFLERDVRNFSGDAADLFGGHTAAGGHVLWCVFIVCVAFTDEVEDGTQFCSLPKRGRVRVGGVGFPRGPILRR